MKRLAIAALLALSPVAAFAATQEPMSAQQQKLLMRYATQIQAKTFKNWNFATKYDHYLEAEFHLSKTGKVIGKPVILYNTGGKLLAKELVSVILQSSPFAPPSGLNPHYFSSVDLSFKISSIKNTGSPLPAPKRTMPDNCTTPKAHADMRHALAEIDHQSTGKWMTYKKTFNTYNLSPASPNTLTCLVGYTIQRHGINLFGDSRVTVRKLSHGRGYSARMP